MTFEWDNVRQTFDAKLSSGELETLQKMARQWQGVKTRKLMERCAVSSRRMRTVIKFNVYNDLLLLRRPRRPRLCRWTVRVWL